MKCVPVKKPVCATNITEECFGATHDGSPATKYTIKNKNALALEITDYGATVVGIKLPLKCGPHDIVLGFDDMKGYLSEKNDSFGSTIGRVAGKIRPAKFKLNDDCLSLTETSVRGVHADGGCTGFGKKLWKAEICGNSVIMKYISRHMEEGYPGTLNVTATFTVTDEDGVFIKYRAKTDKPTFVNLTNHAFFNLGGHKAGSEALLDHKMFVDADAFLTLCETVATGGVETVKRTGYDFREPKLIGEGICQLKSGIDVNYCLSSPATCLRLASKICYEPACVAMEVYTNSPSLHLYTANYLNNVPGKECSTYNKFAGFVLECQGYPNAPTIKSFPSVQLLPGEEYIRDVLLKFKYIGNKKSQS